MSASIDYRPSIDEILAKIDAALANCRTARAQCDRDIERLVEARRLVEATAQRASPPDRSDHDAVAGRHVRRGHRGSLSFTVRQAVRDLIRRERRPMNRVEILKHLEAMGIEIKDANPAKRVGKIVWGSGEYEHTGAGYYFKGEDVPS